MFSIVLLMCFACCVLIIAHLVLLSCVLHSQVVLVASQDLSIGRWADMSVLLEGGSVSEAGAWDDLLARGGSFAAAVREFDAV